jgi:hypothetical protein
MPGLPWQTIRLPQECAEILSMSPRVEMAADLQELIELAALGAGDELDGGGEVAYDVPEIGRVVEATVARISSGITIHYSEPYVHRLDCEYVAIVDEGPRRSNRFRDRFGIDFPSLREMAFDWLKSQALIAFPFQSVEGDTPIDAIAICPANAAFFALGLAMLHGILPPDRVAEDFFPHQVLYVAPPFRHTHFKGKPIVVENAGESVCEWFRFNLYPDPSTITRPARTSCDGDGFSHAMHCESFQVIPRDDREVAFVLRESAQPLVG